MMDPREAAGLQTWPVLGCSYHIPSLSRCRGSDVLVSSLITVCIVLATEPGLLWVDTISGHSRGISFFKMEIEAHEQSLKFFFQIKVSFSLERCGFLKILIYSREVNWSCRIFGIV